MSWECIGFIVYGVHILPMILYPGSNSNFFAIATAPF